MVFEQTVQNSWASIYGHPYMHFYEEKKTEKMLHLSQKLTQNGLQV